MKNDEMVIEIDDVISTTINFNWGGNGIGFGQLSIFKDGDKLICNNECMSRQQVRDLLIAYANHVADNVTLVDENESDKGFVKIPPVIKGVVKITKGNDILKEGMYVEYHDGVYTNPYTGEKMSFEDTSSVECICIRGYITKEELLKESNIRFGIPKLPIRRFELGWYIIGCWYSKKKKGAKKRLSDRLNDIKLHCLELQ